MNQITT